MILLASLNEDIFYFAVSQKKAFANLFITWNYKLWSPIILYRYSLFKSYYYIFSCNHVTEVEETSFSYHRQWNSLNAKQLTLNILHLNIQIKLNEQRDSILKGEMNDGNITREELEILWHKLPVLMLLEGGLIPLMV